MFVTFLSFGHQAWSGVIKVTKSCVHGWLAFCSQSGGCASISCCCYIVLIAVIT